MTEYRPQKTRDEKNGAARSALRIKTSLERASEALASHHEREVRPTLAAAVRSIGQGAPGIARALAPLRRLSGGPGAPTRRAAAGRAGVGGGAEPYRALVATSDTEGEA